MSSLIFKKDIIILLPFNDLFKRIIVSFLEKSQEIGIDFRNEILY